MMMVFIHVPQRAIVIVIFFVWFGGYGNPLPVLVAS
jgi:hypothetical protein